MITAHCLVRNEENFVWYAINSVLPHIDKIFVWDTGSTDKTVEIVRTVKSPKIEFEEKGRVDRKAFAALRQEMIDRTETEWTMVLDGDEVWWNDSLKSIKNQILKVNNNYGLVVNPCYMAVGDIFHYQEEKAGRYQIHDRKGHFNIRFIRNFSGLRVHGFYGDEGYSNSLGRKLQDFPKEKILFSEEKYLHLSHLLRSNKSTPKAVIQSKFKYELGDSFPKDFYYPEVFFRPRPEIVPSPWKSMTNNYKALAAMQTPLKKVKRRIV